MIRFILNDRLVETGLSPGSSLLDFIRYEQQLPGTKIGCREGDCGACTVLEGKLENNRMVYRSITSCLSPLGNAHGKHIVSVEGLNMDRLSPIQEAFVVENATQCGFCTPGFVVALSGYAMDYAKAEPTGAVDSMNGNICRCTGYKSIERAAVSVARLLKEKDPQHPLRWLVDEGFLPGYFMQIPERIQALGDLSALQTDLNDVSSFVPGESETAENNVGSPIRKVILGGGTDLMVQKPDEVSQADPVLVFDAEELKGIRRDGGRMVIGAAATANDIMHSPLIEAVFPDVRRHFKLVSSDPIRNMGTLGGNLVNASPIADLVIYFMVMDPLLQIRHPETGRIRETALKDFFLDYKKLDLHPGELVINLSFDIPENPFLFNFEKVSKRTHLDIASVNAAALIRETEGKVTLCRLSCGGVGPTPVFLKETSRFLSGKEITVPHLLAAEKILQEEISPISDIRGSERYKRLLAGQLLFAHFLRYFPGRLKIGDLIRGGEPGYTTNNTGK